MTNKVTHLPNDDLRSTEMLSEYMQPFQHIYDDESFNEICINRPREVWTENRDGWIRHDIPEMSFNHCKQLATLIAGYNGKSVSSKAPILSAAMPGGARVQVILPPACEQQTVSITIRKPSLTEKSLDELEAEGAFAEYQLINKDLLPFEKELITLKNKKEIKKFLKLCVLSKRNIMVVGATGSGKTYLTKSLVQCIPLHERLVTVEDVNELFLRMHPNKVHLFFHRDSDDPNKVTPKQCLEACLRMKPSRILFAELRGDEAWEYIKSINNGHPGSISTMHANGAFETFDQLTALVKDSRTGTHLDASYIKQRLITSIDVIIFYDGWKLRELYYDPEFKREKMA